jgi:hypothetical protein
LVLQPQELCLLSLELLGILHRLEVEVSISLFGKEVVLLSLMAVNCFLNKSLDLAVYVLL